MELLLFNENDIGIIVDETFEIQCFPIAVVVLILNIWKNKQHWTIRPIANINHFLKVWFCIFTESLKLICEAFQVAMDICELPPVLFKQGQTLDRRKSKILNSGTSNSNIYLDVMPHMTRNVSESQLLTLKSVGK